ncbi:MAG: neutral/alkaline non-lysosomal ceramidase N-terminal domain-containing protein [Chloroflexota bacterium]
MKMGSSRVPFEWAMGLPLAGYINRTAPANGIHRELYLRATIISTDDDAVRLCLVSGEVLSVDHDLTHRLREEIHQQIGIPTGAIMVAATHTHASVGGLTHFPVAGKAETVLGAYASERVDQFIHTALQAVQQAYQTQTTVSLWYGKALTHNIAANRRDPNGTLDPNLPFVVAKDDHGEIRAAILNYACHPTILNADNHLYSGDLIGTACALMEDQWGVVVGLTGAAGNISTRFTRRDSSTAEVERMAQELVNAVQTADLQPLEGDSLAYAQQQVILPIKPAQSQQDLQQALANAQARLANMQNHPQRRIIEAEIEGLQVQLSMGERPTHITTEVQVFRIGSAHIISLPGELFVEYGLDLISKLAPNPVLIAGYANDYIGYVTTVEASDGYEADSAIVPAEAGSMLIQAIMETIKRMG